MEGSLLRPWVEGLVGKAADALVQSVTSMWGVDDYRSKLERQLVYVRSLLADAEEKAEVESEAGRAVKAWMKKLKAAAYRADDVLDDFQYEALRREAEAGESTAREVFYYFTRNKLPKLPFNQKASRDLKDVLDKIEELVAEMNDFGLLERAEEPPVLYRQTHSALDDSLEIFGRDDDKEVLVKLLLNQKDQNNVQVLPIIGMGGLGKTTLAKMVYNDCAVQNHFELKMWHCVSENFEATAVVRSAIGLATKKGCDLPDNIELLQGKLQEVIGRKRFLLILDDVWNEEQHKWEENLKPLLCSSIGGSGSIIVVTTRSRRVASIMGTLQPHELACLSEDDSWKLFSKKAFSEEIQGKEEFVTTGRRIVNKCKGLPLALKTMGGLMSSKQQVHEWEAIADSNISDTNRGRDEVMSILKLSYKHLSPEMKQCFAFCAVFLKDYEMEKDMLIQLWMANGYIHEEGTMNLAEKAESVYNELVWRSFLQSVILEGEPESSFIYASKQELNGCKMHDLMHDLAKDVATECTTVEELIQRKVSIDDVFHLQISTDHELYQITQLFRGTIRTLLIDEDFMEAKLMTSRALSFQCTEEKLMSSRALSFQCTDSSVLDRQLICSTHLRYLDLSNSKLVSLPNTICKLYNLLSLRLNNCRKLQHLPESLSSMRKLSHIYLLDCESLERMPPKLSLLNNLRTLTTFVVDTDDGRGIEELEDMRQLGNRLELCNLRKVKCGSKANLHKKQNLNELLLYWGRHFHSTFQEPTVDESNRQEQVLESLVPHSELKSLEVHGYGGFTVSHWMRGPQMFHCLRELIMKDCRRCKDLPVVWLLPSLEHLSLCRMESLTTLCKNIDVKPGADNIPIFPKLKALELLYLPELERWVENSAGEMESLELFPQLEVLTIQTCDKLATLPESPVLRELKVSSETAEPSSHRSMRIPLGFFASLVHFDVGLLVDVVMPRDGQQIRRPLDTLRNLQLFGDDSFVSIFNQSKLRLGLRDCLAFVEDLSIYSCSNIVRWPAEEFRCLPRLRSLHISNCAKLDGNGSSSEEILLPQLERLTIRSCVSLLEFLQLPASLEKMEIHSCKSLVALPSNLGNLTKLRNLGIQYCYGLRQLPDGMDGLTSLERLSIWKCPGIEEFPQGLLQRLPALKSLSIMGCPDLERRCREGGECFDLVSSIPNKEIVPYF